MRDAPLAAMQRDFGASLLGDSPDAALKWVQGDDGLARDRLFIYRRNVQTSLLECLQRRFSRVAAALGSAQFDSSALRFIREHPPTDEALVNYGGGFPEFLQGSRAGRIERWLPSLAKLELFWHQSYHERDDTSRRKDALSEIDPSRLSAIRFQCHRTLRAFPSDYDLLACWEDAACEPAEDACLMLIIREAYTPNIYRLQGAVRTMFECLHAGGTAADAFSTAENDAEFTSALAKLVSMGVFSRVVI